MKFVVNSTLVLEHMKAISREVNNNNNTPLYAESSMAVLCSMFICKNNDILDCDEEKIKLSRLVNFESYLSASVQQLQHQLAIYTGLLQSTLYRVLRNTRIHTLSIFFGLCCSSSGYIFNAITGTSSHPIPANI